MLLHWQLYNFLNTYTNNYPYNISHFITNHSLNILSAPHPSSLFKTELHKGSNRKPTRSWRSERLRLPSVTLNAEVKGWHLDQVSVRGGKSTTQQRKPYFIKLENKNIILGTKIKKKKGMVGREASVSGHKEGTWRVVCGICASEMRRRTQSPRT